jgi:site-specific DNA-methyltransferase (adenine-specific)/adenine-specific DNA-methyltransferase
MPTLNWIGKDAVINHHHEVKFRLLKDVAEHGCGDPGTGNLIVEGDNLEALKALLPYYAGQVKCIYIDPPYNTGNEGWVYNDNVKSPLITEWLGKVVGKEGETLDRHDRWLCMMYPRLALLKEFLREDGSIWVSLDDNEIQALRYVMDEIFGAQNFVAQITWQKVYSVKGSAKFMSEMHDYVAVYGKNVGSLTLNLLPRNAQSDKLYKNLDNDPKGAWRAGPLAARNFYSEGTYPITCPSGRVIDGPPKGSYWRFSKRKFDELNAAGRIYWGKTGDNVPAPKLYLSEVQQGVMPSTIWFHTDAGHNQDAKKELISIIDDQSTEAVFTTPKPTRLIERILQIATNPGDLVLDSFAGSGTTGHAVLKMNAAARSGTCQVPGESEGLGKSLSLARRFILVEMEPTIAKTITAERVKRVAEGYTNAKGEAVPGLGGGFRYCQLGEPLFDEAGQIRPTVKFGELARHVWFTETGEPLPRERVMNTPLLGVHRGTAIYLLYNGILGDRSAQGGNVLTRAILADLPAFEGPKVIYAAACLLGPDRLSAYQITVRQTPKQIRTA